MSEQVSGNPAGVRANRAASSFGVVVGRVHAPHQPPVSPQVLRAGGEFEVVAVSDDAESSTPILYLGHTGDMQVASRDEMRDYVGRGLLDGKRALITGGDSGIGRAVAFAFAKGADVAIAFFEEDDDAALTRALVEKAGRRCVLLRGDLAHPEHCRAVVAHTVEALGGRDVPVNNVAYQQPNDDFTALSDEQWRRTFAVNIDSFFPCQQGGVGASARRRRDHQYEFDQRPARQKHPDGLRSHQVRVPVPEPII